MQRLTFTDEARNRVHELRRRASSVVVDRAMKEAAVTAIGDGDTTFLREHIVMLADNVIAGFSVEAHPIGIFRHLTVLIARGDMVARGDIENILDEFGFRRDLSDYHHEVLPVQNGVIVSVYAPLIDDPIGVCQGSA